MSKIEKAGAEPTLIIPVGLGLTLLLATWLRFYRLAGQSLWSDEGNSLALAQVGLGEIASRTALDIHPPLYYWLLHGWMRVFGESEAAVRSLSAIAGVLLVVVVYRLGTQLFNKWVGLLGAFIAAVSPFQVYYAQETRMYALLALLGALTVWATAGLMGVGEQVSGDQEPGRIQPVARYSLLYVLGATLGFYTHYAFPLILLATNLAVLVWLWRRRKERQVLRWLAGWLVLQLVPLMLYLPWLPIAWRQLTTWPAPPPVEADNALGTVWRTLVFGPVGLEVSNVWLVVFGLLMLVGVVRLLWEKSLSKTALLLLYLGLPVALTVALFKPAYLKFLLVASPAFCLLLPVGLFGGRAGKGLSRAGWPAAASTAVQGAALTAVQRAASAVVRGAALVALLGAGLILAAAWGPLSAYYFDPAVARDDYRGIARYLEAVAGSEDAIILNAAGQQEVFGYYFRGDTPVYPLPRSRPLDLEATLADLEAILTGSRRIFALYWATGESDPQGTIEGWLAEHTFQAADVWVGNVRLVSYAAPLAASDLLPADIHLGEHVTLTGYRLLYPSESGDTAGIPGEVLQVQLRWMTDVPLDARYVVFLQALDEANHLAGQRDAEPALSTLDWEPGQPVLDRHGLLIEPGTPPGEYRIIAGLYDAATGQRLPAARGDYAAGGDFVELGTLRIERPETPPPLESLGFQHSAEVDFGPLRLLGYDRYKLGHSYDPDTPLHPGDPLHVVLYWQAQSPPQDEWQIEIQLAPVDNPSGAVAGGVFPAAGVDYPTTDWVPGEVVRAQFDLFLPGDVAPGEYRVSLRLLDETGSAAPGTFTLSPVSVE